MNAPPYVEEERLRTLQSYAILDTPPEKAFDDIARLAARTCGVPIATVSLLDHDRQWFKACVGLEASQVPRHLSFCAQAVLQKGILEVADARRDALFRDSPFVTGEPHVRFYAGVPLMSPDGHALGTICVIDRFPRSLSDEQRGTLEHLSRIVMAQMELRKLAAEREAARAVQAQAADALRGRTEVLSGVLAAIPLQVFWKDGNSVYLGCNPAFASGAGLAAPGDVVGRTDRDLPWSEEEAESYRRDDLQVMETGRAMIDKEEKYLHADGSVTVGMTSKLPLRDVEGRVIGVLGVSQDISGRRALEAERERLLSEMGILLAEAEARADRDPLTGLLNHRAFHRRLAEETECARRDGQPLAVVMLDLDDFRFFNDTHGHLAGDDVLRRVADSLRRHCRPSDTLTRFGGDKFTLLMPGLRAAEAEAWVQGLRVGLDGQDCVPPGHDAPIPLRLSAGVAVFPDDGRSRLETLAAAEARLRLSKTGGGQDALALSVRAEMSDKVGGFSMLDALVTAVDAKDRYTRRHSEDVMTYSLQIADGLGLDAETRRTVAVAALLHDVGKVGVPDAVLRKPGRLSDAEAEAMRQHPMMGAVMVGAVPGFEGTLDAVRHHHERWDGGGYPFGLRGEETPLLARLMAVADAFSAMTTDRPYRKGMAHAKALEILADGAGAQWDPVCVAAFLRVRPCHGAS